MTRASDVAKLITNGGTIIDGNIAFASGHGVDFSSTSDASGMTSELISDYETGIWTPTYTSASASFSYNSQYGTYAKIGGFVHLQFYLHATASGTTSNTTTITGLPYAVANINSLAQSGSGIWFSGSTDITPIFTNGGSAITLWKNGAVAIATASNVSNNYLVGSGSYRAS